MEFLWKHGPQSPADLHAALEATYGIAYTTVYTELTRLVKKGMVRRASRSDARYAAALTREEFMQLTVTHVLEGLIQSHGAAAIHGFVDLVADDSAAYDELRKALKNRKKR